MNKNKKILNKDLMQFFLNKYVISVFAFVIWVSFVDGHNLISQSKLKSTISKLRSEKEDYKNMIASAKIERQDLEMNEEKYARENYYMHKENEKVFIILNDKKEK